MRAEQSGPSPIALVQERVFFVSREAEDTAKTNQLIAKAKEDALSRVAESAGERGREKVITSIEKRLKPYVAEGEIIADQLASSEYKDFKREIYEFLQVKIRGQECSDGRLVNIAFFDPGVGLLHKRPQGFPETRTSSADNSAVLEDETIAGKISATIKKRQRKGRNAEMVEFFGPHIDSMHPIHGCGAAMAKIELNGRPIEEAQKEGMKLGGIDLYFDELGNNFSAFNNDIRRAGGIGTSFDMTHDSHSQGLIFGLRNAYLNGQLNPDVPLRQNLERLHHEGKILMTELLDRELQDDIVLTKLQMNVDQDTKLDIKDPHKFTENMMLIGRIAKMVTEKHEQSEAGFSWIPGHLQEGKSANAIRALAYTAIRNSVYRNLADIKPGEHDLLNHPEQLVRVGPIGASFNTENIAFVQVTANGRFTEEDIAGTEKLYGLAEKYMPQLEGDLKADFTREGRIILVTGEFDGRKYQNEDDAIDDFEVTAAIVRGNASRLRRKYAKGVVNGDTPVIGAIFESGTKKLTHIITSEAKNDNLY